MLSSLISLVESDTSVFHFNKFIDLAKALYATKRNISKVSASFYDFISRVTARVKCIFEVLCKDSYDWDEKVNNEIKNSWLSFLFDLGIFVFLGPKPLGPMNFIVIVSRNRLA